MYLDCCVCVPWSFYRFYFRKTMTLIPLHEWGNCLGEPSMDATLNLFRSSFCSLRQGSYSLDELCYACNKYNNGKVVGQVHYACKLRRLWALHPRAQKPVRNLSSCKGYSWGCLWITLTIALCDKIHHSSVNNAWCCAIHTLFSQDTTGGCKRNVRPNWESSPRCWIVGLVRRWARHLLLWLSITVLHVFHLPRLRRLSPEY